MIPRGIAPPPYWVWMWFPNGAAMSFPLKIHHQAVATATSVAATAALGRRHAAVKAMPARVANTPKCTIPRPRPSFGASRASRIGSIASAIASLGQRKASHTRLTMPAANASSAS